MLKTFSHKPSLMCLCSECSEFRAYYKIQMSINWANGSLMDGALRVDRTPPKGYVMPVVEAFNNKLLPPNDPHKDILFGVR